MKGELRQSKRLVRILILLGIVGFLTPWSHAFAEDFIASGPAIPPFQPPIIIPIQPRDISVVLPPPLPPLVFTNDNFAQATVIQTNSYADKTPLYAGTAENGEPMHSGFAARYSRWWVWRAPTDGLVEIDVYPEHIAVYTGDALEALQGVELSSPPFRDGKARRFAAKQGVKYHFAGEPGEPGEYRADEVFSFHFDFSQIVRTPLPLETNLPPNAPVELEYKPALGAGPFHSMTLKVDGLEFQTIIGGSFVFRFTNQVGDLTTFQVVGTNDGKAYSSVVDRLQFNYPNDNIADAAEIDGQVTRTNIPTWLRFATVETNEPPVWTAFGLQAPTHSRWFKWRPQFDGLLDWGYYSPDCLQPVYEMTSTGALNRLEPLPFDSFGGDGWAHVFDIRKGRLYYLSAASFLNSGGLLSLYQRTLQLELQNQTTNYYLGDQIPLRIANSDPRVSISRLQLNFLSRDNALPLDYVNGVLVTNVTPTHVGYNELYADGYDIRGDPVRSNPIRYTVRPANDLIDRATSIPRDGFGYAAGADSTNASIEEGEPEAPVQRPASLWWTWTPSEAASMVLRPKPSQIDLGFWQYLAVFERQGGELSPVADNRSGRFYATDAVYFDALPGQTYLIQGCAFADVSPWVGFLLERAPAKSIVLAAAPKPLIVNTNGQLLEGSEWAVQCYVGSDPNALRPIGWRVGLSGPGNFFPSAPVLENVSPGTELFFQVRAWRLLLNMPDRFRTFEWAETLGVERGISAVTRVRTADALANALPPIDLLEFVVQSERRELTLEALKVRRAADGEVELIAPSAPEYTYQVEKFVPETGWSPMQTISNTSGQTVLKDLATNGVAFYRTRLTTY